MTARQRKRQATLAIACPLVSTCLTAKWGKRDLKPTIAHYVRYSTQKFYTGFENCADPKASPIKVRCLRPLWQELYCRLLIRTSSEVNP